MFTNLLLATDGSSHAYRATQATIELAQKLPGTNVTIVYVSHNISRFDVFHSKFDIKSVLEEEAHRVIRNTENLFKSLGVSYTLKAALGDPADQIIMLSKKEDIDLIIIGRRGLSVINEFLLRSVSRKVTHHAECAVMIVK